MRKSENVDRLSGLNFAHQPSASPGAWSISTRCRRFPYACGLAHGNTGEERINFSESPI
jgi:hypothetical protein